jgi:hypothetical protein
MNFHLPMFGNFTLPTAALAFRPAAIIEVALGWFNGTFVVQEVGGQLQYCVNAVDEALYGINLAYASLSPLVGGSGAVVEGVDMRVHTDAIRYLARELLGVPDEQMFGNLSEVRSDLIFKSGMGTEAAPGAIANIKAKMTPTCRTDAGETNICREIYRQLPDSRKQLGAVVFEDGDSLNFTYTCQFADTVESRAYTIKLRMRATVNPLFSGIP